MSFLKFYNSDKFQDFKRYETAKNAAHGMQQVPYAELIDFTTATAGIQLPKASLNQIIEFKALKVNDSCLYINLNEFENTQITETIDLFQEKDGTGTWVNFTQSQKNNYVKKQIGTNYDYFYFNGRNATDFTHFLQPDCVYFFYLKVETDAGVFREFYSELFETFVNCTVYESPYIEIKGIQDMGAGLIQVAYEGMPNTYTDFSISYDNGVTFTTLAEAVETLVGEQIALFTVNTAAPFVLKLRNYISNCYSIETEITNESWCELQSITPTEFFNDGTTTFTATIKNVGTVPHGETTIYGSLNNQINFSYYIPVQIPAGDTYIFNFDLVVNNTFGGHKHWYFFGTFTDLQCDVIINAQKFGNAVYVTTANKFVLLDESVSVAEQTVFYNAGTAELRGVGTNKISVTKAGTIANLTFEADGDDYNYPCNENLTTIPKILHNRVASGVHAIIEGVYSVVPIENICPAHTTTGNLIVNLDDTSKKEFVLYNESNASNYLTD